MGVRIALAASVVFALGASCGGDDPSPTTLPTSPPPTSTASTTTPPTSTPSPTPTPPALPAAARADSPAGAEAFARFWLTTLDYASTTGDTRLLRQLANCTGCNAIADGIEQLKQQGGRTIGGQVSVTEAEIARHIPGKAALVDVTYDRAARVVERGTKRQSVAAEKNVRLLITLRRSDTWLITNAQPAR